MTLLVLGSPLDTLLPPVPRPSPKKYDFLTMKDEKDDIIFCGFSCPPLPAVAPGSSSGLCHCMNLYFSKDDSNMYFLSQSVPNRDRRIAWSLPPLEMAQFRKLLKISVWNSLPAMPRILEPQHGIVFWLPLFQLSIWMQSCCPKLNWKPLTSCRLPLKPPC